jgi:hypothetical protein
VEILLIKVAPIIILQLFGIDLNYIFQDYKIKLLRKNKINIKKRNYIKTSRSKSKEVYLFVRKKTKFMST